MFGARNSSPGEKHFGGIYYDNNRKALEEFLGGLSKSAMYLLYEYDINMNPYHDGTPSVFIGTSGIARRCTHVSHIYELRDANDKLLCQFSFTFSRALRLDTPDRVHHLLH